MQPPSPPARGRHIAYASRAFALYYMLQCCVARLLARTQGETMTALRFGVLAVLCLLVFALGIPSG